MIFSEWALVSSGFSPARFQWGFDTLSHYLLSLWICSCTLPSAGEDLAVGRCILCPGWGVGWILSQCRWSPQTSQGADTAGGGAEPQSSGVGTWLGFDCRCQFGEKDQAKSSFISCSKLRKVRVKGYKVLKLGGGGVLSLFFFPLNFARLAPEKVWKKMLRCIGVPFCGIGIGIG